MEKKNFQYFICGNLKFNKIYNWNLNHFFENYDFSDFQSVFNIAISMIILFYIKNIHIKWFLDNKIKNFYRNVTYKKIHLKILMIIKNNE